MMDRDKHIHNGMNRTRRIQNILVSTTLVGSLIMAGNVVSASGLSKGQRSNVTVANADMKYNDLDTSQSWANDMLWAVEKGLIKGYVNQKHPTTGKYGNWLNPYGVLTEAQALTVMLRYTKPTDLQNSEASNPSFFASVEYQVAQKYNLPTNASLTNQVPATKAVTRGKLAQLLVTLHTGKQVSAQDAVQYMYVAGLSTGYPDTNGDYPKTYDSYKPNDTLKRSQIASFVKRYDTFMANGAVIQNPSDLGSVTPPIKQVVNGIKVDFGKHTYGSKTQAEYDQVMQLVAGALESKYNDIMYSTDVSFDKYHDEYINGARGTRNRTSPDYYTERNLGLLAAESNIGGLVKAGVGKEDILKLRKGGYIAASLLSGAKDPLNGAPESAYDALVRKITDCDSDAQVVSAVFDTIGYNTTILVRPGHASIFVEIQGKWFDLLALEQINMSDMVNNGLTVHTQPTNGDIINPNGTITKH